MRRQQTTGIGMFGTTGWRRFKAHDEIKRWANAARKFASGAAQTPALKEKWLQCEGTWYVGVDVLHSDEDGRFEGIELAGPASELTLKQVRPAQCPQTARLHPKARRLRQHTKCLRIATIFLSRRGFARRHWQIFVPRSPISVSYTHLTLPTILLV